MRLYPFKAEIVNRDISKSLLQYMGLCVAIFLFRIKAYKKNQE
jgi:hypothetical protein